MLLHLLSQHMHIDISRIRVVIDCLVYVQCMMSVVPVAGDIYNNPPHSQLNLLVLGITPGIVVTCYAVTNGPDRNIYWVYDDIKSTDTAIQTPVRRGVCFETRDSIAVSQQLSTLTDPCSTCRRQIGDHMTAAQATTAFTTHAASFPATHVRVITPPAAWCCSSAWYCFCSWYHCTNPCCRCCCCSCCCTCCHSQHSIHTS